MRRWARWQFGTRASAYPARGAFYFSASLNGGDCMECDQLTALHCFIDNGSLCLDPLRIT